jgi:hypothetical protein
MDARYTDAADEYVYGIAHGIQVLDISAEYIQLGVNAAHSKCGVYYLLPALTTQNQDHDASYEQHLPETPAAEIECERPLEEVVWLLHPLTMRAIGTKS